MSTTTRLSLALTTLPALLLALPAQAVVEQVQIRGQNPALAPALASPGVSRAFAAKVQGQYRLADGRLLVLSREGAHMLAEVDGMTATPLSAAGALSLRSSDGKLTLEFQASDNGLVHAVKMSVPR